MKRFFSRSFFSLIFLAIPLMLFSGCQFLDEADQEPLPPAKEEIKLEKKLGLLTVQKDPVKSATHALKTDTGEELPVSSGKVNLRKYEKRRVEIEAKKNTLGVYEVEDITKVGREDDTREPYKNARLGFSLQYVSLWEVAEKEDETVFTPYAVSEDESVDRIIASRTSNSKNLAPEKWLDLDENYVPKDPTNDAFYAKAVIGPDQMPATKRTSKDGTRIDFYLNRQNYMYRLTHMTIADEDEDRYRNIFFDMVNSFQFLATGEEPAQTTEKETVTEKLPDEKPMEKVETPKAAEPKPAEPSAAEPAPVESAPPADTSDKFRIMESDRWKIKMSYPKNLYWARYEEGYAFGEKSPETAEDVIFLLDRKTAIPENLTKTEGDIYSLATANSSMACKKLKDAEVYCISGPGTLNASESAIYDMVKSLSPIE